MTRTTGLGIVRPDLEHHLRRGLTLASGAPFAQVLRRKAFRQAHPGADFTPSPVGGRLLAWVPCGSGGVQFSGESLEELLDEAEEYFSDEGGPDG